MYIETFDLERDQSLFENHVDFNLTESGVHPFTLRELLNKEENEKILDTRLTYGQTNGSVPLRQAISQLYQGADSENILVTNGSAEANLLTCLTCLEHGDEVALMLPNYMQIWGMARAMGVKIKPFRLEESNNWSPNLEELEAAVTPKTKMIIICNPNNPTGSCLSDTAMAKIVTLAENVGAWVYADEVYRGAELNGKETKSFFGMSEKVMVAGGLSKAYALPGLRLGWLAGPKETISQSWATHDYTSIAAGVISNYVGTIALAPAKRQMILDRNRSMLRENLACLKEWAEDKKDIFSFRDPQAGGMVFIRYHLKINSTQLCQKLRKEQSVFVVAGDSFGMDNFIRIGIGSEKEYLLAGLERINTFLEGLAR